MGLTVNDTELIALVEEILELGAGTVKLDDLLEDIEWDSLANITFIAEIDTKLNQSIEGDALNECKTVKDLGALVAQGA